MKIELSFTELAALLSFGILFPSPLLAILKLRGVNKMDSQINDLLEVKAFLAAVVKAGIEARKNDGKIDFKDSALFIQPLLIQLPPALDNIGDVGNELKVLPEHIDELVGSIGADFGLDEQGDVAFFIREGVILLQSGYRIFKHFNAPKVA